MFRKLMSTTDDFAVAILRMAFGVVSYKQGANALSGARGGCKARAITRSA